MERRTHEAPMEFEWQTRAPGDATSPFYQLAMEHERQQKKRLSPPAQHSQSDSRLTGAAGPYSVFDSPVKPSTPSIPQSSSQQPLFRPETSSNLPRTDFTTPRKVELDFSSGPENPSSPENADNDETPDSHAQRRGSLFSFYGRFGRSPGRGEIPRSNKLSNVLIHRVKKRRRRDRELGRHIRRASEDTEYSDDQNRDSGRSSQSQPTGSQQAPPPPHEIPFLSRLFTFLESHPHIPRILSYYAQFAFNLTLAFLALYVILAFLLAIRSDVIKASEDVSADILAEMAVCARNYVENRCTGDKRLPALEVVCDNWERCMNRDPAKVGKAKVSAQTLAEIVNGFIEPISFKAMFFFIASLTSFVAVSNFTFTFFRNKSNNPPHTPTAQPPPHAYRPFTPPGMSRQASQLGYSTSQSAFGATGTPNPFGYHSQHSFNHGFNMTPGYGEGAMQRRIEYRDTAATPSPSKNRKFL